MLGAEPSVKDKFSEWSGLFRARIKIIVYTSVKNPVLNERDEAVINRVWHDLQQDFVRYFLPVAHQRNSLFAQPCYFLNRALRVPVWMRLHDILFSQEWSGRLRDYDLSKGFACDEFCPAAELAAVGKRVMVLLRKDSAALVHQPEPGVLVPFLAKMHTYLNYVHPFVDGNGRLQRLYMNLIAAYFHYWIEWGQINRDAYLDAVRLAFRQDLTPLNALLGQALKPLDKVEA